MGSRREVGGHRVSDTIFERMKQRRITAISSVLLAAVAICGFWLTAHDGREPHFKQRKLSEWITEYRSARSADARRQAEEAIRAIGTNALPPLLLWIRQEDSDTRQRAFRLVERLGFSKIELRRALRWRSFAFFGFRLLGPAAGPAIPELTRLLENDSAAIDYGKNLTVAESAVLALGEIGAAAIPALSRALTNRNVNVRKSAALKLGEFGLAAGETIPALVGALSDTNVEVRLYATRSLGQIHENPGLVVPALVKDLSNRWDLLRKDTALALAAFGPQAEPAVPQLMQLLSNKLEEPMVRNAAQGALRAIAGDADQKTDGRK